MATENINGEPTQPSNFITMHLAELGQAAALLFDTKLTLIAPQNLDLDPVV